MSKRKVALMLAMVVSICGCIGTSPAGPSDSYAAGDTHGGSKTTRKPINKTEGPCEPPEVTTGDLYSVGTNPCERTEINNQQVTQEPPEIHPY